MVFIYVLHSHPRLGPVARSALELVQAGAVYGVTSTLTLAELLVMPSREQDEDALDFTEGYLVNFPNLALLPLTVDLARDVAQVRAATRLKLPDAIQIATAIDAEADVILSNDAAWRGRTGPLELILLKDFAAHSD
jgi:predicted nucleic acid-binding protein